MWQVVLTAIAYKIGKELTKELLDSSKSSR